MLLLSSVWEAKPGGPGAVEGVVPGRSGVVSICWSVCTCDRDAGQCSTDYQYTILHGIARRDKVKFANRFYRTSRDDLGLKVEGVLRGRGGDAVVGVFVPAGRHGEGHGQQVSARRVARERRRFRISCVLEVWGEFVVVVGVGGWRADGGNCRRHARECGGVRLVSSSCVLLGNILGMNASEDTNPRIRAVPRVPSRTPRRGGDGAGGRSRKPEDILSTCPVMVHSSSTLVVRSSDRDGR